MSLMVEAALRYSRLGWYVFPCYPMRGTMCGCGRPQCTSPGKHPVWIQGVLENGLRDATLDEGVIRAWWGVVPDANIGVVMEPSGLCALDLDRYHGDLEKLAVLEQQLGPLPSTVTQCSGSHDGFHAIFKAPGFKVKGVIGGIVVRANAYIIVAPSNHASGKHYEWQEGLGPTDIAVAEFPDAWKAALERKAEIGQAGVPTEEPEWLAMIPAERRLEDAHAHITKERGEVKGQSKPGTTFDVIRSVVRRYALRDPEQALELAQEYDQKCVPPWGARIARHVWSAYNKATEPSWGYAYRGVAERLSLPAVPDATVQAHLESMKTKRPSDPQKIQDKNMVVKVLNGTYLGDDTQLAAETLVRVCPPGTSDAQIVGLLVRCSVSDERAEELVRGIRLASAAKVPRIDDMIPEDVWVGGVRLGQSVVLPSTMSAEEAAESDDLTPDQRLLGKLRMADPDDGETMAVKDTPFNLSTILNGDSILSGHIRFNSLTKEIVIDVPPFNNKNPNTIATFVMNYLDSKWHCSTSRTKIQDQLLLIARDNAFNPVADYLLPLAEKWDRVPRNDTWLIDYCGAEDNVFNRMVGAMWLRAAVARGVKPGSKVDTVLILEGKQGAKKSRSLGVLGGPWFSGSPINISTKDGQMMASACWIIELAELASLRQSETDAQKQFLSTEIDTFRPPYGAAMEKVPRFAVFCGSVNPEEGHGYLTDSTGNRRYWPVAVQKCDALRLLQDREQIWAEAVWRYLHADLNPHMADPDAPGERWWFASEEEEVMARAVVEERRPENVWASVIRQWISSRAMEPGCNFQWTMSEIAQKALQLDHEKLPSKQRQVAIALKDAGMVQTRGTGGRPMWKVGEALMAKLEIKAATATIPVTN